MRKTLPCEGASVAALRCNYDVVHAADVQCTQASTDRPVPSLQAGTGSQTSKSASPWKRAAGFVRDSKLLLVDSPQDRRSGVAVRQAAEGQAHHH